MSLPSGSRSRRGARSAATGAPRSHQKADHELIRTGPYRFVRHPIYTAIIGMFFGTALVSGDLHAFLAAGVITVAYARKIRLEERNLSHVFGARYDEYRRTTRALIPWVL